MIELGTNSLSQPSSAGQPTICLLVPDGRGVLNFVLGPFLDTVTDAFNVQLFHKIPADLLSEYSPDKRSDVQWHELTQHRERAVAFTLRSSLAFAQMHCRAARSAGGSRCR